MSSAPVCVYIMLRMNVTQKPLKRCTEIRRLQNEL